MPATSVVALPSGTDGLVSASSFGDLSLEVTELSSAWNNWSIKVDLLFSQSVSIENLSPEICSSTNFPLVEKVASGKGRVKVAFGSVSRTLQLDFTTVGGSSSSTITGFETDTLGAYTWSIIEPLLIVGGDAELLTGGSGVDFGSATYNAECWAVDFDFSGVAHKQSERNNAQMCGTAITRQHLLMAAHYLPAVGTTMTFIAPNGDKITRSILAYNSGNTFNGKVNANVVVGDKAVAVLSDVLPESIKVYPVVGDWIYSEINSTQFLQAFIGFKLDQQRRVQLAGRTDLYPQTIYKKSGTINGVTITDAFSQHGTDFGPLANFPSFLSPYSSRYDQSISGDSGTPRFLPLNATDLALVGCVSGSSGNSPFPDELTLNAMAAEADMNAGITTGTATVPGGAGTLTVTVAPDPTL